MNAEPLNKKIYDKAKSLNIKEIRLEFSGGSDEGYLNVYFDYNKYPTGEQAKEELSFIQEVEEWVWDAYKYNGAGDGSDYGDNIVYNLKEGTVSTEEWYTQRSYEPSNELELKIEETVKENE